MLATIIKINGLYDVLCALTILQFIDIPQLAKLHTSMFIKVLKSQERELLAYWIFINGVIRLSSRTDWIVISYILEAGVFTYELVVRKVHADKALFVIVTSLLLAYLCVAKN